MEIRRLTPAEREKFFDLSKIIVENLNNKAWLIPMSNEEGNATFKENSDDIVLGGFVEGKLVATLCLLHDISDYLGDLPEGYKNMRGAEIGEAMVRPEYRKQGLLNQVWSELKKYIEQGNYDYILATAHPDNDASNHFINRCGFRLHLVFNRRGKTRNMYILDKLNKATPYSY